MNSRSFRRVLGAAAAPALLLVTACGGASTATPSASEPPVAASSSPAGDDSLDAVSVDSPMLSAQMIAAVQEKRTARIKMTVSSPEGDMVAKGAVRYGPKKTQLRLTMTVDGDRITMVLDGKMLYLRAPGLDGGWMRISGSGDDPVSQAFAGVLENLTTNVSVDKMSESLVGLEVTEVGPATVGGVPVTEYSYPVTTETLRDNLPDGVELSDEQLGDLTGTVVFSVDETGLLHRMVSELDSSKDGNAKVVVRFTKWGEPVTIKAPAKSELVEFPTS